MLITNHSSIYANNQSVTNTQSATVAGSASSSQISKHNAPSVTLSENGQSQQSTKARAVAQYEAMILKNGLTQNSDTTTHTEDNPTKASTLSAIPSIKTFNEADVRDYEKKLANAFSAAGIDTSQGISITTDFEGKVVVKGDHPDKERIEAIFAENDDLRNGFVQTSQHYLFKELYRLNQEWAQKVDAGVDIDTASQWLLRSAKQATAASSNGLTLNQGSFSDPFTSQGVVAKISSAYGV